MGERFTTEQVKHQILKCEAGTARHDDSAEMLASLVDERDEQEAVARGALISAANADADKRLIADERDQQRARAEKAEAHAAAMQANAEKSLADKFRAEAERDEQRALAERANAAAGSAYSFLERAEKAEAECARLAAIVERLPKYEDTGEPIVQGDEVWSVVGGDVGLSWWQCGDTDECPDPTGQNGFRLQTGSGYFKHREAAEAAVKAGDS